MYTIKRASELVGVSDSTLRAWERRYGLDLAHRTPTGYRLYDDAAVASLRRVRDLTASGWSVGEAAAEVRRRAGDAGAPPPDGDPRSVLGFAEQYDAIGLTEALDRHLAAAPFETVMDDWLLPGLREVGDAWCSGSITVAGEHLVASSVTRRLAREYDAATTDPAGPRVIIGLPPGAHHDLGLLAFATAARRIGLATTYLGADVPAEAWVASTAALDADAVVLAAPMVDDLPSVIRVVGAVHAALPAVRIAVGGSQQDLAPPACLRLGHRIGPAAAALKATLSAPTKE